MRRELVGVAYAESVRVIKGGHCPAIVADIRKQYSQHQRYPMIMEVYETDSV